MNANLFFAVWDLPELRSLIRSFMWPGKKSATWYEYRDLAAACANGYRDLLIARSHVCWGEWDRAAACAVLNSHSNMIEELVSLSAINLHGDIIGRSLHKGYSIASAKTGCVSLLYVDRGYANKVAAAAANNGDTYTLARIQSIHGDIKPPKKCANLEAMKWFAQRDISWRLDDWLFDAVITNRLDILKWIVKRYPDYRISSNVLEECARRGNLKILRWLLSRRHDAKLVPLLEAAVRGGFANTIKHVDELISASNISKANIPVIDWAIAGEAGLKPILWLCSYNRFVTLSTVELAAKRGDVCIMEWVLSHTDASGSQYVATALSCGNIKLAMWLMRRYGVDVVEYSKSNKKTFESATSAELRWLLDNVILVKHKRLLEKAVMYGYLEAAAAIHSQYRSAVTRETVEFAILHRHINTAEWARKTFSVIYTWDTFIWAAQSHSVRVMEYVLANVDIKSAVTYKSNFRVPKSLGAKTGVINYEYIPADVRALAAFAAIDSANEGDTYAIVRILCAGYSLLRCKDIMLERASNRGSIGLIRWLQTQINRGKRATCSTKDEHDL